jgi:hypothetical protein
VQLEPVSPELVLVDPALAQRERARLEEVARLEDFYQRVALRRAEVVEPDDAAVRVEEPTRTRELAAAVRRGLVPTLLMCSLLANGVITAILVTRNDGQDRTVVVAQTMTSVGRASTAAAANAVTERSTPPKRVTTRHTSRKRATTSHTPHKRATTPKTATHGERSRTHATTGNRRANAGPRLSRASVERKVLMLLMLAPRNGKVRRRFVDQRTGLIKNNVQVACERRRQRVFLCSVRLPNGDPSYVRYRKTLSGRDSFQWIQGGSRYRNAEER